MVVPWLCYDEPFVVHSCAVVVRGNTMVMHRHASVIHVRAMVMPGACMVNHSHACGSAIFVHGSAMAMPWSRLIMLCVCYIFIRGHSWSCSGHVW